MPELLCPVCGEKLSEEEKRWFCEKGHSFDKASSGYVNLLISHQSGKIHGDDKAMVRARRDFLDGGYYEALKTELCKTVLENSCGDKVSLLDSGCGECYYTAGVEKYLKENKKQTDIVGIDISKDALKMGDRRGQNLHLAVASAYRIPVSDASCDVILNVFAPFAGEEYLRCLKNNGVLIHVSPDEGHLWELKQAVYEKPYLNDALPPEQDGLVLSDEKKLRYRIDINKNSDIKALFMMTPYAHKTSPEDIARLDSLEKLNVAVQFVIRTYKKL